MVQIPRVNFNTFQSQPVSTGGSFNVLQSVGQAMGQVAGAVQRKEQRDADAYMADISTDFAIKNIDFKREALEGGKDFAEQRRIYDKLSRTYVDDIKKNAPSQYAVDRINEQSSTYQVRMYEELNRASVVQAQNKRKLAIDNSYGKIVNSGDDLQMPLADAIALIEGTRDNSSQFTSPEEAAQQAQKATQDFLNNRVARLEVNEDYEGLARLREEAHSALTPDQRVLIDKKIKLHQQKATQEYHNNFATQYPKEYIKQFKSQGQETKMSFNSVVSGILESEGGFVAEDGASGAPANFGINQAANPDIDVANLTEAKAKQIYKERYWDAIAGDMLPSEIQYIAMDAAVNQGVNWTLQALDKSQGDLDKFYELRKDRYNEIAKNPRQRENLKGWLNRLDDAYVKGQEQQQKNFQSSKRIDPNVNANLPKAYKMLEEQKNLEKDAQTNEYYGMANAGNLTVEQVDGLLQSGQLDRKQHKIVRSEADRQQKAIIEATKYYKVLNTGDASNPDYQNAVNWSYDNNVLPMMQGETAENKALIAYNAVMNTEGVIPKTLDKQLKNAFNSNSPDQGIFLARTVKSLGELQGRQAQASLPDNLKLYAHNFEQALINGMSEGEASRIAFEMTDPDNKKVEIRQKELNALYKDKKIDRYGLIEKYGDHGYYNSLVGFFTENVAPDFNDIERNQEMFPALSSEFSDMVEYNFIRNGGDIEQATELAKENTAKVWGVSIGGKLMKHPPEKMYGFKDRGLIEIDFYGELSKGLNIKPDNIDGEGYSLLLNPAQEKAIARGEKPVYTVIQNGATVYTRDTEGKKVVLFYQPDIEKLKTIEMVKQELASMREYDQQKAQIKMMAKRHNLTENQMAKRLLQGRRDRDVIREAITSAPEGIYSGLTGAAEKILSDTGFMEAN